MKNVKLNIIKKNRKYYACETNNGYKCKLLIDSNSDTLDLGEHDLLVDDISVRSKYRVDIIYKLACSAETQNKQEITTLKHFAYNSILVEKCRNLGGRRDRGSAGVFNTDEVNW